MPQGRVDPICAKSERWTFSFFQIFLENGRFYQNIAQSKAVDRDLQKWSSYFFPKNRGSKSWKIYILDDMNTNAT